MTDAGCMHAPRHFTVSLRTYQTHVLKRAYLRTYARHGMKEAKHGMKEAVAAGGAAARQCLLKHGLLKRELKRDMLRQEATCEAADTASIRYRATSTAMYCTNDDGPIYIYIYICVCEV